MKNIFKLLIIIVLLSANSMLVKAIEDTTPPTIKSISLNKSEIMGGDTISYTLTGEDDISGIRTYMLEYRLKSDSSKTISVQIYNNSNSNTFTEPYTIPATTMPGEWEFYVVQIWDVAGNLRTYWRSSNEDNQIINFGSLDLVISEDPTVDLVYPILNNVTLSPKEITPPGSFTVTINASDNVSDNLIVSVLIGGLDVGMNPTKVSSNTYTATFDVSEADKYKNIKIDHITLMDEAGNRVIYANDISGTDSTWERRLLPEVYQLKILGVSETDTSPPILKNYEKEDIAINVPAVFRPVIEVTDDISGFSSAKMTIVKINEDGSNSLAYFMSIYAKSKNGDKYSSELVFDQYNGPESYLIESIELIDFAGNSAIYSITSENPKFRIEEKIINLVKGESADVNTGTMNENYESTIKESADTAVISIDATKNSTIKANVFDSIRNTNKTVIINNSGIEWVFNGADIDNESKDINTQINISTFADGGDKINIDNYILGGTGLIIEFYPNGLLPGRALVKIKADYTLRNYVGETDLYVYYYNQTSDGLEAVANKISISEKGYYEFYITHNSTYLISSKKANTIVKDSSSINEDINTETIDPKEIISNDDVKEKTPGEDEATTDTDSEKEELTLSETSSPNETELPIGIAFVILLSLVIVPVVFYYKKKTKK